MMPQEHQKLVELFNAALAHSPDRRARFLSDACNGDDELRRAVDDMLAADECATYFLEQIPEDLAASAILAHKHKDEALVGRTLGEYKVIARLGAGGMGDVFLAKDLHLHRNAALKFLSREFASDAARLKRFEQEAYTVSALNDPNIVTVYGLRQVEDLTFLATEFVEGQTLREAMNQGPLTLQSIENVASQVAHALQAAHSRGIVHRDIKPENIMLRPDGLVKVLDFGLAKWTGTLDDFHSLKATETMPGLIMGTPRYMSPEQARGQSIDNRTDLFSFGAVLYEMVTGRAAMEGITPSDIIASILMRDPMPLTAIRPECPRSLAGVIERALEKDRDKRYSSAGDMLSDLKWVGRKPGKIKIALRMGAPWRRWAAAAGCACAVLMLTILLVRSHTRMSAFDSIGVLPINNHGPADLQFVADGLTDSLIDELSEIPNLRVSGRSSVVRFRDQPLNPQQIGKMLRTRTILAGEVSQSADRLSVQLQLTDVDSNLKIWGETYNPVWDDLLEVEGNISKEVVRKLRVKLNKDTQRELEKCHDVRPEAYRLYLRGHSALHGSTQKELEDAVLYFHRALETDSTYGPAAVDLANAYVALSDYISPRKAMPKAREYALRAIGLGGAPSEAHASLGLIKLLYDWDWQAAENELRWDSPVNPREIESFSCYLHYRDVLGRNDESLAVVSRLLSQDPLSAWMNHEMGCVSYYARRYHKAIEQFLRTVKISPEFQIAYVNGARAFVQQGRYGEAIKALEEARKIEPKWPMTLSELAYAYAEGGMHRAAIQVLNELNTIRQTRYVDSIPVALAYLRLGDRDTAFSFLEKAYEERSSSMPWLNAEPRFDAVRSDPRFQNLLRRVGLVR